MTQNLSPFDPAALERAVPRYTSYPTAPHFRDEMAPELYGRWLEDIGPERPVSLYLHVPFCDELCWFCACRTQGSKKYAPVARYLDRLIAEIGMVADRLGDRHEITQMHWGGGSPTILAPEDILRLHAAVLDRFPRAAQGEFAVEIDPRDMTEGRLDALAEAGVGRASIGVQDFEERVQLAIGRMQGHEMTRDVIQGLRARGVRSVNVDFLYGLPRQTIDSLSRTIERVIELGPDRLALFGYAHVPWMAKRQKMIRDSDLPGTAERRAQAEHARELLTQAGYEPVGIDHFAKPTDALAQAARDGTLKRNFQGYTVDRAEALVGMGASAIGNLPQGYAQNEPVTAVYQLRVEAGQLPVRRGYGLTLEDRMRRDAIEQILCTFSLDIEGLTRRYGDFARTLADQAARLVATAPEGALETWRGGFRIDRAWRDHARLVAAEFDAFLESGTARHSLAV